MNEIDIRNELTGWSKLGDFLGICSIHAVKGIGNHFKKSLELSGFGGA